MILFGSVQMLFVAKVYNIKIEKTARQWIPMIDNNFVSVQLAWQIVAL